MSTDLSRWARIVKWVSIALIILAVFLIMQTLPVGRGIDALEGWITGLGVWGPVVFALIYVAATVLMLPGSLLTLAGGAFFGLGTGTIAVSLGSTVGAAAAFLIGRYFARDKVAAQIRKYPKFDAIDQAIGDGGWRIVALLRLSPIVPFNLQNYLYGLTKIRFWPCVIASWLAMLPGTFMFVYLGYLARAGAEAASGAGGESANPALTWGIRIVGLLATVAVTVYVTKIATRAVGKRTKIEAASAETDQVDEMPADKETTSGRLGGTVVMAAFAILLVSVAAYAQLNRAAVGRLFGGLLGPAPVTMQETWVELPSGATFDHTVLHDLLTWNVRGDGSVDYAALAQEAHLLDGYIGALASAPIDEMGRSERLALLINAYNAFTLRLILDHHPVESIKDIAAAQRWDDARWNIGGERRSLNQIEHEIIRPNFIEPRIHFAIVCAAVGCSPLRDEAYTAEKLEAQLADQVRRVHADERRFRFDADENVVHLTPLYRWYGGDFEQTAGSVLEFVASQVPEVRRALDEGRAPRIEWLDYDWSLNEHNDDDA